MVLHTCERMAAGGIHDQLGGGFARYSVDAEWLVPHFEKMLYDNAQLAQLYLDAYLVSGEARYAEVARDILDYVLRDMTHPEGGFYSAEDADSEGHEGKFYCWTADELAELLTPEEFKVAARYFGVTEQRQFRRPQPSAAAAGSKCAERRRPGPGGRGQALLASAKAKMQAARDPAGAPASGRQNARLLERADARGDGPRVRGAWAIRRTWRPRRRTWLFSKSRLWDAGTQNLVSPLAGRRARPGAVAGWLCFPAVGSDRLFTKPR